jgi:hypothetical protein
VGFSTGANLTRDPDDPSGCLKMLMTDSFDVEKVLSLVGGSQDPFTLTARAFLPIEKDGESICDSWREISHESSS